MRERQNFCDRKLFRPHWLSLNGEKSMFQQGSKIYRTGATWGWEYNDKQFIFGWTIALTIYPWHNMPVKRILIRLVYGSGKVSRISVLQWWVSREGWGRAEQLVERRNERQRERDAEKLKSDRGFATFRREHNLAHQASEIIGWQNKKKV